MMEHSSEARKSVWLEQSPELQREPLREHVSTDVCVIGAGIAGLTTAYLLAGAGQQVVILEKEAVGDGETGRTTAHLASALDDRFYELERLHGERGARLAAESHAAAIEEIERIVAAEKIDCGFSRLDGYLFLGTGSDQAELERELQAASRAGLRGVELVARVPALSFDTGPSLRFPNQGQFHPMRYLAGLAAAFERRGGRIFTGTQALRMNGGRDARVETAEGYSVVARALVVATNTPVNDRVTIHTKQAPYRTYAMGLKIPSGSIPQALYWDTADPYHYVRITAESDAQDLLIVGGEDHKTGQEDNPEKCFRRLEAWTRERFPAAGAVAYQWSGQVLEPVDSLAFIGRNPLDEPNVYIATGDSGHGMTHGTIAGMLIRDLILGRENAWAELYDPSRVSLGAIGEFARENLNVAAQYADYFTGGDVDSVETLAPGCGAVIRDGLRKVAVYREESGGLRRLSAVCPHLGCVVNWNEVERSWDCPCHGSRFDSLGQVVNGPAQTGLEPVS